MTFLAAHLLPLLALAAVPILIHLLTRRRRRVVPWAAMDFLQAVLRRHQRRLQTRELILMLLRTLAVLLLALAAARPSVFARAFRRLGGGSDVAVAILLDNSLSMKRAGPAGSRFDAARRAARQVVDALPDGSAAALALVSDRVEDRVPEPSRDLGAVAGQIERAAAGDGGTAILPGLRRAWDLLAAGGAAQREIYLVSDMQACGWPRPDSDECRALLDALAAARPKPRVVLVDVGDGARGNVSLEALECADELVAAGERAGLRATVRFHGPVRPAGLRVDAYARKPGEVQRRKLGSQAVEPLGERVPVTFSGVFDSGEQWVELELTEDALNADNAARLVLAVGDALSVLVVDSGDAPAAGRLEGDSAFLRAALLARGEGEGSMRVRVVNRHELAAQRVDEFDLVILADVADLPRDAAARLVRAVRADGCGLLVFAGERTRPEALNELLGPDLLPARLGPALSAPDAAEFGFAVEGLAHPVVRFFADPQHRALLAAPRFRTARRLDPGGNGGAKAGDPVRTVLAFDRGGPALMERLAGRGRVLLYAADAARAWSDLPLRPAYLLLVRRAAQHAGARRGAGLPLRVHEPWTAAVPAPAPGAWYRLRTPWGDAARLSPEYVAGESFGAVRFADTRAAGFYLLEAPGNGGAARSFAVNPDPRESDLAAVTEEDVRARYRGFEFRWIRADADAPRALRQSRTGNEIWGLALALAALCLLLEQVLGAVWAPKEV